MDNILYYGDNLEILREHIKDEAVDLIYLDPPFNSKRDYNLLFKSPTGADNSAQVTAFEDTWHWGKQAETEYTEVMRQSNTSAAALLNALRAFLGENDMMAYLVMMTNRLLELRRVLKPTGSIYLHCDPTASHYLKLIMDSIFSPVCFRNEVIWSYRRWPSPSSHFQRMHDVLLFYARSKDGPGTFNIEYEQNSASYDKRFGGKTQMLDPATKTRKITLEEDSKGLPRRDVWDISIIAGFSKERLGYPTQKPLALLERIITASSNPGDLVLDPFCGCGTAVHAAEALGRQWIGIDITHLAVSLIEKRLKDAFPGIKFQVEGTPKDVASARYLAEHEKYQFQWWACSLVNAQPYQGKKKGADGGIDGLIFFQDDAGPAKKIIISVKGGEHVSDTMVKDLIATVEHEKAAMGFFITLAKPTAPMVTRAVAAGFYHSPGFDADFPRIQVLTIEGLMNGTEFPRYPDLARGGHTFKKARKTGMFGAQLLLEEGTGYNVKRET